MPQSVDSAWMSLQQSTLPFAAWVDEVRVFWSQQTGSDVCDWLKEAKPGIVDNPDAWPLGGGQWLVCRNSSANIDESLYPLWEQIGSQWQLRWRLEQAEHQASFEHWLLSSVSHDLRSPLNSIIGFLGMLEDVESDWRRQLPLVQQETHRLHRLINQLLDFSRLQVNKLELVPKPMNVLAWVSSVVQVWRSRALQKGVYFRLYLAENLPNAVELDAERLHQIVDNLINNALKFTAQGTIELAVMLEDNPDELIFEVTDTGPGIDPLQREQLFEPFRQAGAKDQFIEGGVGLGLNIVKQLTALMNGRIDVVSEPGHGSVFRVSVPFQPTQDPNSERNSIDALATHALLIDDDSRRAAGFSRQLAYLGIETSFFQSGPEALFQMRLHAQLPDWIFISSPLTGIGAEQTLVQLAKQMGLSVAEAAKRTFLLSSGTDQVATGYRALTLPTTLDELDQALTFAVDTEEETPVVEQPRVLVVDDTDLNLQLTQIQLEKLGLQVLTASSGKEALETMDKQPVALVFMDIMMPEMDGYETTAQIRERERARQSRPVPIIALTANALFSDPGKCHEAGMDDYLAKPYRPDQLHTLVRRYLPSSKPPPAVISELKSESLSDDSPAVEPLLVDWPKALTLVGGDEPILKTILLPFIQDLPKTLQSLKEARSQQDWSTLQRRAHSLKGMLRTFGAVPLGQAAYELEKAAQQQSSPQLDQAWEGFMTLYQDTLNQLMLHLEARSG